jgi:hypothetical protein
MASMKLPRLTLLVAMYVSLDVANPLMPGALSFGVEDSVEARQADRFRGHDDLSTLPLAPASELLAPVKPSVTRSRLVTAASSHFRRAHVTRSEPSLRTPALSPEDH